IWVGPPPAAMRAMGGKSAAKALMAHHGVPILPGYHGEDQDPHHLAAEAARTGFPLLIKAVSGGGGRGMRVVTDASGFAAALAAAQQEAASAFGDPRVLIERYLPNPRHIEVQVFADTHGNAVHLFERDCSAQRRHQKVIEEAPAPGLDPARRAAMGSAAVTAAQAVGYVGAGTVEFVADAEGFWFLEMNTRLQVEHPVTEAITGFDLVEWQLRVAAGETLPARQEDIACRGHAIEARLYAEDPARDFAPSIGRLIAFDLPAEGDGVRVDAGMRAGDTIPIHYDAMLGKIICHGATRAEALAILARALSRTTIAGVACNLDLLGRIVAHPDFAVGGIDTGFIAREASTLLAPPPAPTAEVLAIAALGVLAEEEAAADPASPWAAADLWWLNRDAERVLAFLAGETHFPVRVRRAGRSWRIAAEGREMDASATRAPDGRLAVRLDRAAETVGFVREAGRILLRRDGATWTLRLPEADPEAAEEDDSGGRLVAPIPGQVTAVHAEPGARVARGAVLVMLEAMKTVFRLSAPADLVVEAIACRVGETVSEGQVLVTFLDEAAADAPA
ncbi:MAG: 3-methylcrotonyl-CoA carboxylase, partial [Rhodospirillales bacterium]|nr:3-methylcrotonyl-CoA carboxylase [Rhodospirillales bacterium]